MLQERSEWRQSRDQGSGSSSKPNNDFYSAPQWQTRMNLHNYYPVQTSIPSQDHSICNAHTHPRPTVALLWIKRQTLTLVVRHSRVIIFIATFHKSPPPQCPIIAGDSTCSSLDTRALAIERHFIFDEMSGWPLAQVLGTLRESLVSVPPPLAWGESLPPEMSSHAVLTLHLCSPPYHRRWPRRRLQPNCDVECSRPIDLRYTLLVDKLPRLSRYYGPVTQTWHICQYPY